MNFKKKVAIWILFLITLRLDDLNTQLALIELLNKLQEITCFMVVTKIKQKKRLSL